MESLADLVIRFGLNLQRGQRLLLAEPYELQGVSREANILVDAISAAATRAGASAVEVIWGDPAQLRRLAENKDWSGFVALTGPNAAMMQEHIDRRDALLFLQGSQPRLFDGLPATRAAELNRLAWQQFGPVARRLTDGATNWSVVPAPAPAWADFAYADLPADKRLTSLWTDILAALRIPAGTAVSTAAPVAAWQARLAELEKHRAALDTRRARTVRFTGPDTDLTVRLPSDHRWCTARLRSPAGIDFVANLPTEEIFTAPERDSAEGTLRVSRPINHAGAVIDGITLRFHRGEIVEAAADRGAAALEEILATDEGALRLGEVALVPGRGSSEAGTRFPPPAPGSQASARPFFHPLLDENATHHVALGGAYTFTAGPAGASRLNRSLIHVDLPLAATAELSG